MGHTIPFTYLHTKITFDYCFFDLNFFSRIYCFLNFIFDFCFVVVVITISLYPSQTILAFFNQGLPSSIGYAFSTIGMTMKLDMKFIPAIVIIASTIIPKGSIGLQFHLYSKGWSFPSSMIEFFTKSFEIRLIHEPPSITTPCIFLFCTCNCLERKSCTILSLNTESNQ